MNMWSEFVASSWGREFVAGSVGGTAGVITGYPLDTFRIWQQQHSGAKPGSGALATLRHEGPCALYRGMFAPLASIAFQNAIVFQSYATLSRAFDTSDDDNGPPSYKGVALGGIGAGVLQSVIISPIELVKIRLQLQTTTTQSNKHNTTIHHHHHHQSGPLDVTRNVLRSQGWRGLYRGLGATLLRDSPSHGVYFWTYEFTREQLQPGCRKNSQECGLRTMLVAGGLAGVTSWISCYPFDVLKTKIQAKSRYTGICDCFRTCVKQEGYCALWRGLGTTLARAFVVNGVVFVAYETALGFICEKCDHTQGRTQDLD